MNQLTASTCGMNDGWMVIVQSEYNDNIKTNIYTHASWYNLYLHGKMFRIH